MSTTPLDARIARLEGGFEQVNERLGVIEQRLGRMEENLAELRRETGLKIETLRRDLTQRMDQQFFWTLSLIIIAILVPIALRFLPS